jgi:hypothetical protein
VADIWDSVEPGVSREIIFVWKGRSTDRKVKLAEVRTKNKDVALRPRKYFANKKKNRPEFWKTPHLKLCHESGLKF